MAKCLVQGPVVPCSDTQYYFQMISSQPKSPMCHYLTTSVRMCSLHEGLQLRLGLGSGLTPSSHEDVSKMEANTIPITIPSRYLTTLDENRLL